MISQVLILFALLSFVRSLTFTCYSLPLHVSLTFLSRHPPSFLPPSLRILHAHTSLSRPLTLIVRVLG
jgi:hypothetical protein